MRVIIMGPQGAGKGTQAAKLEEETGATHIETGDLVRSEIKQETELGKKIKEYSDKGELVPDEIIIDMTKPYLDENDSWILDGFPRNKEQAKALDEALKEIDEKIDKVVVLEAPAQEPGDEGHPRADGGRGRGLPVDGIDVGVPLGGATRIGGVRGDLGHRPLDHDLGEHVDGHRRSA